MAVTWGSIAGNGRIGLEVSSVTNSTTSVSVYVNVWVWSKYRVNDSSNTVYVNGTNQGSVVLDMSQNSGSGWSTSNQKLVKSGVLAGTYNKSAGGYSVSISASISAVEYFDATPTVTLSYNVPSLTSYTVSYNANGGSGAPSAQTKYYNVTLTLSSTKPTRSGYTFVGWGLSANDTSVDYSAGGSYTSNASITLYAIWKKTILLTYNANGGSGAPSAQSATVYNATTNYKFTISNTKPTRDGYLFLGWSTSSASTSASYAGGDTITLSTSDILYAVWLLAEYDVVYNANGGTGAPATQTKIYNQILTLSSVIPTRTSIKEDGTLTEYVFHGWATSSTATSVQYKAGANYTANADVTLYAVWGRVQTTDTYIVSYNTNGGSEVIPQVKIHGKTLTLRNIIPVRHGYTFAGWGLSADATTVSYEAGASYTENESIVLYAIWTPWTHTVEFNANGGIGSIPSSFVKTTGVDVITPDCTLTKDNCVFRYWSTSPTGSGGTNYYIGDGYTGVQNGGTVTLYAIWKEKKILFYATKECEATEFVESSGMTGFGSDGIVYAPKFVEGEIVGFDSLVFYFGEIVER